MFLASILEYSQTSLNQKLSQIQGNSNLFRQIQSRGSGVKTQNTNQQDLLSLHLDFVCQQFARTRKVLKSLSVDTVFESLNQHFWEQKLDLTVHLMAEEPDIIDLIRGLYILQISPNWQVRFFVPLHLVRSFDNLFKNKDWSFGIWLDKDQWQDFDFGDSQFGNFLLMTVFAGKSGQKLEPEIRNKSLEVTKNYPEKNFILDGGWPIDVEFEPKNLQIVSYSSFWKYFDKHTKPANPKI